MDISRTESVRGDVHGIRPYIRLTAAVNPRLAGLASGSAPSNGWAAQLLSRLRYSVCAAEHLGPVEVTVGDLEAWQEAAQLR